MTESFSAPLNPEGESIKLDAARDKSQELVDANDGRHTDVFNARALIVEAEKMVEELCEVKGAGPEVLVVMKDLRDAIDDLNDTVKQVH